MTHSSLPADSWPPMQGPFARWPRFADAALCLVVLACNLLFTDQGGDLVIRTASDLAPGSVALFSLACIALYWRRRFPLMVLGVSLLVIALQTVLADTNSTWALPFAVYAVGRYANNARWRVVGVLVTLLLVLISSLTKGEPFFDMGFAFAFLVLIWTMGRYLGVRGDYLRLLEQRAAQLERERASEAQRAVAEERTRIARELHDVVAHRVSLMTVQAGAAKTVAEKDPQAALQAMGAVELAGRQALDELRHLLGVLRPAETDDALLPQPGLDDLARLADQMRAAGLQVSLHVDGDVTAVPARVALSVHRIVQEAMTNVLRHAGQGASAEIEIGIARDHVEIRVADNGTGATILAGAGHGIVGMRERAQLLGGYLQAGPRQPQGFEVSASLPLTQEKQ